jgi:acetoin utilization deacetylase AcuC-like enzyme
VITAVTDDATLAHDPEGEVWVGVPIEGTESSGRVTAIRAALADRPVMNPTPHPVSALASVHDPSLIGFLETAWDRWSESGYPSDPGQSKVVPYVFPAVTGVSGRHPRSIGALAGLYAMDTMTLLGSGSWRAIKAAADCALTAADRVEDEPMYALCRPPGHHAGRAFYGGSCYLNNAALAAQRLVDRGLGPVTVIDVDAHHGNGTQEIFYHRDDVRYASVHVDPGQGWFPHFVGFADETGDGEGSGANLNEPLAPGSGDGPWLDAVARLCHFASGSASLVVSLGVDAAADDPESPLEVTTSGYRRAGRMVGELGLPAVIVQEGGYHLPTLGGLVVAFLEGAEAGGGW